MKKVRYFLFWLLLNKKERSVICASINSTRVSLNSYTDGLGESHKEFVSELDKLNSKWFKPKREALIDSKGKVRIYEDKIEVLKERHNWEINRLTKMGVPELLEIKDKYIKLLAAIKING